MVLDSTVVNVSISQVVSDLKTTVPEVRLAITAYTLAMADVPAAEMGKLVGYYSESQIDALKRSLLLASAFVLVGLWFARALPGEALVSGGDEEKEHVPVVVPAAGDVVA